MSKKPIIKPRAVRAVAPEAESFVNRAVAEVHEKADAKDKRIRTKADGATVKQMTVYVPTGLDRRLRLHCADIDKDRVGVITKALSQYLDSVGA